jgi:hypothetical protein
MEITLLWRESVLVARVLTEIALPDTVLAVIVLAFTVLTLRMFVQFITLLTPDVKTYPVGTKVDNDMIHRGEK